MNGGWVNYLILNILIEGIRKLIPSFLFLLNYFLVKSCKDIKFILSLQCKTKQNVNVSLKIANMKKLIIIPFILLSLLSYSQDFKVIPKARLEYEMSGGFYGTIVDSTSRLQTNLGNMRTDLGIEFQYRDFSLHFDNSIYMKLAEFSFYPIQSNFVAKIQYKVNDQFKVYIEHACFHPTKALQDRYYFPGYYGGYTKVGVSYNY